MIQPMKPCSITRCISAGGIEILMHGTIHHLPVLQGLSPVEAKGQGPPLSKYCNAVDP